MSVTLTAVQFVTPELGWCVGHLGVVLQTRDGGQTWVKQLDGLRVASLALEFAADPASNLEPAAREQATKQAQTLTVDGPDKPFFDLHFASDGSGLVVGAYNLAFRTTDGGKTWRPAMHTIDNPKGLHVYAMRERRGELFAAGEQGIVLRSTAAADRLAALPSPYKGTLFGIALGATGTLLVFGLRGKAFASDDDGKSWRESATGVPSSISSGIGLADGRFLLATQAGDVLLSDDGARTFKRQVVREPIPLTSLNELAPNDILATTLRGVRRLGSF